MKRTLAFLLVTLMLLSAFTACAQPGGDDIETTTAADTTNADTTGADTTGADTTPVTPEGAVLLSDLANYKVLYSSSKMSDRTIASTLCTALNALQLGKKFESSADQHFDNRTPVDCEILIGLTDRPESGVLQKDFLLEDYGYRLIGKKIVIYAHSSENLKKAVEKFIADQLSQSALADTVVIDSAQSVHITGNNPYESVRIGVNQLSDCVLVYPKNGSEEKTYAEELHNYFFNELGFFVPVQSDDVAQNDDFYEILIGATNRAHQAPATLEAHETYVMAEADSTLIAGKDGMGLCYAVDNFKKQLVEDGKNAYFDISDAIILNAEESQIRSMSFNVLVGHNTSTRAENVIAMIKKYNPDTFGVQEASPDWMNRLKTAFPDYGCVGVGRENGTNDDRSGEHCAVFYRKSMFELLSSGTKWLSDTPDVAGSRYSDSSYIRIVTWAVLQRKSDGFIFTHANTHLDTQSMSQKQQDVLFKMIPKDYPILLTGDFNFEPSSSNYEKMMNAGYKNASRIAEKIYSELEYNKYPLTTGGTEIDYLYFKAAHAFATTYRVCNEDINGQANCKDNVSDHFAVYAEFFFR